MTNEDELRYWQDRLEMLRTEVADGVPASEYNSVTAELELCHQNIRRLQRPIVINTPPDIPGTQ